MSFGAITFSVVEAGHQLEDPKTGEKFTVTDETAVFKGDRAWVTQKVYDAIKARTVLPA